MKKMFALLVTLALGLGLAISAPASASTPAWSAKDRRFVKLVRAEAPWFYNTTARLMIESAHSTCDLLDTGFPESEAAWMMVDAGFTKRQSIVFVSTAMAVYCPWHGDDIRMRS